VSDAAWSISYLADDNTRDNQQIVAVIQARVTDMLVELLRHKDAQMVTPALRAVGNLCTGDDASTQVVLDSGLLAAMPRLLAHSRPGIRKESLWCLSNVTGGSAEQLQAVMQAPGVIEAVMKQLGEGEFDVQKEATW